MNPADHRAKAEELLAEAEAIEAPHRRTPDTRDRLIAEAQLHATLAIGQPEPEARPSAVIDTVARAVFGDDYSQDQRRQVKRSFFPLLYSGDLLTSEPALAAFREAWEQADAEGAKGDRVRRGMAAAIEAVS